LTPPLAGQSSDSEVHALQNDSLLTVTLPNAKASQIQDYWREGDRFWRYNPAVNSGYSLISVQRGSAEVNQPKTDPATGQPVYTYLYDSATLWVYSASSEEWTQISSDSLYDSDAHDRALLQRKTKYDSDVAALRAIQPQPANYADQMAQIDAKYAYDVQSIEWAKYVKPTPSFNFRFDSKHLGKLATVVYSNAARTKADYGAIPSQTLGGYFGDINDYAHFKTNIETFNLTTGSKTFNLKKAVYLTLRVLPASAPWEGDDFNSAAETWTKTNGSAYVIKKNAGGAVDSLEVEALNVNSQIYNGSAYENIYHFTNPKAGIYVFPALEGQKLIFRGTGEYQDGVRKQDGAAISAKPFQAQWLGGYKNLDIIGNPKNLHKVAVGATDKSVGTINLTRGSGKIQGMILGANTGQVNAGGVVGDHYESGRLQRDTVFASFADYAAYLEHKSEIVVERKVTDNSVPSNESEYINGVAGYVVSRISSDNNGVAEITKAEYDATPEYLLPTNLNGVFRGDVDKGRVWIGPKANDYRYYKYNWIEVTEQTYLALPEKLQAGTFELAKFGLGKGVRYYQKPYYSEITLADYNALATLHPELLDQFKDAAGVTHYLKANYLFRKSPTPAPATEAEYDAYISAPAGDANGRVYNGGPVSIDTETTGYVEIPQAEYDALPAYWNEGVEKKKVNGKLYRRNMVEITLDVFNTLPDFLKYSAPDKASSTIKYFRNNYYQLIDAVAYNALPDQSVGKKYLAPTGVYQYYKELRSYKKDVVTFAYWQDSVVYTIDHLASGVYFVEFGGQVHVVVVKNGATVNVNFKKNLKNPNTPQYLTEITGVKGRGKKLTAKTRIVQPGFGQSQAKYNYYWTNGVKIMSKKAAYRVTKSYVKKNLWVLSVATFKKYQTVSGNAWTAAPGNTYGVIGFDVSVTGAFKKGKKVTAVIANEQVSGVKYRYQWLRNGKAIKKATKASYKITKADRNKKISVKVSGKVEGYRSKSVKSIPVKAQ
jgi:hypothetical protein